MFELTIPALAQLAFFPFSIVVFKRMEKAIATAFVVFAGLLFLPEITIFSITDAVQIHKDRIIYLGALIGFLVAQSSIFFNSRPAIATMAIMIPMMVVNVLTMFANPDSFFSQGSYQSGLGISWVLGQTIDDFFTVGLPFVIAKAAFHSYKDLEKLLYMLVGFGLAYTSLILLELLMAIPFRVFQLSHRFYGISFIPQFRFGLTEPAVFMGGGHLLATFMLMPFIAALSFKKANRNFAWRKIKKLRLITALGLVATLKVGSLFLGIASAIVFTYFRARNIVVVAAMTAFLVCVYPFMQIMDIFPEDTLVEIATEYTNEDRGRSFAGRFYEEEFVLDGIGDRLFFGWGTYARIPGGDTVGAGTGETGLDAWWVIKLGHSGVLGMELFLLILAYPIWKARKRVASRRCSDEVAIMLGAISMCIVVRMTDLMLNGWWNSLPVFLAGALYAICKYAHRYPGEGVPATDAVPERKRIRQYAVGVQND